MNSLRKRYWAFSDRHPKFNRIIDKISLFFDRFMFVYIIVIITLFVVIPSLCIYVVLDESVRQIITPIFSAAFSVIVVPIAINCINHNKEEQLKRYEINAPIYKELSETIIFMLKNFDNENNTQLIKSFLNKNYSKMCVSLPYDFIWDVYLIYRECNNGNKTNVLYYSEKCLRHIRNQLGLKKEFYISQFILDALGEANNNQKND